MPTFKRIPLRQRVKQPLQQWAEHMDQQHCLHQLVLSPQQAKHWVEGPAVDEHSELLELVTRNQAEGPHQVLNGEGGQLEAETTQQSQCGFGQVARESVNLEN